MGALIVVVHECVEIALHLFDGDILGGVASGAGAFIDHRAVHGFAQAVSARSAFGGARCRMSFMPSSRAIRLLMVEARPTAAVGEIPENGAQLSQSQSRISCLNSPRGLR
jgi:hypothetical protein